VPGHLVADRATHTVKSITSMAFPRKYPQELRDRAMRLARESDRPVAHVARDLGIHPEALRTWLRQDEAYRGERADLLSTAERLERGPRGSAGATRKRTCTAGTSPRGLPS
jgi:transposase-like protein